MLDLQFFVHHFLLQHRSFTSLTLLILCQEWNPTCGWQDTISISVSLAWELLVGLVTQPFFKFLSFPVTYDLMQWLLCVKDISDLFGADLPVEGGKSGEFAWRDGPFLAALRAGHWIVLDEVKFYWIDSRNTVTSMVVVGFGSINKSRICIFVCH